MQKNVKRAILTVLSSAALAASMVGLSSTSASASDVVDCTSPDFTKVEMRLTANEEIHTTVCIANAGETIVGGPGDMLLEGLETGNNTVSFYGDGKWWFSDSTGLYQPIGPHKYYYPSDRIDIEKVRIL